MSEIDENLIQQLIEERDRLLDQFPMLRPLQEEIDRTLEKVGGSQMARLLKSFEMLSEILTEELQPELSKLKAHIDDTLAVDMGRPQKRKRKSG